ncbi:hypothetical protein G3480_15490 [Thiorhodococcus mannitoliphagus]|uniref:Uncharacterized protein n=1 Tax=Thiorhodococcus mannitoliphagus TaxID=329406 RepID=A0A6P1DTP6_9GAMM|nr:hypothetical protein [Thiorhodococcus mannitoliphagus]NEX21697.1 hypothetical protein [Thiorhodococcus mannitoliphagus]
MQIIDKTVTVGVGGQLILQMSCPAGTRVRVIVVEESDVAPSKATALAHVQEGCGFAFQVLSDPAEDVWNDL